MLQKLTSIEDAAFICCHKKRQGNADRRKQIEESKEINGFRVTRSNETDCF